jgi:hypothetical protein
MGKDGPGSYTGHLHLGFVTNSVEMKYKFPEEKKAVFGEQLVSRLERRESLYRRVSGPATWAGYSLWPGCMATLYR